MARSPQPPGRNGDPADAAGKDQSPKRCPEEAWGRDTPTSAQLGTLSADKELLASLRKQGASGSPAAQLRAENEEMRSIVAELRQQLDDATAPNQGSWEVREREFETILEEKSEEIRLLYMSIQELERKQESEEAPPRPAARSVDSEGGEGDINALADELAQDKSRLEEEREQLRADREQLRQDEEEMEQRMQEMELQTSKSRADLVKQRNELHRVYNEVRAELEQAKAAGGALSERVQTLERETQELSRAGRGR